MEGVRYIDTAEKAGWNYLYEDCFEGINLINHKSINCIIPTRHLI